MSAVELREISRVFGTVRALDKIDLAIAEGEFFAMLGPSGSGKTTSLRLIAGFEQPSSGAVRIFGEDVTGVPPYRRAVNTVFQDYALFPHMSVLDNVAYSLMLRKVAGPERHRRAEAALEMVRLGGYGARKPGQLSGGQRQRVALARAIVNRPKVLLLDEPLGALDLKLREEMQEELKSLQRTLGITFVFVTHDQGEALSMADRVAVFDTGRVAQVGTPEEIYRRPASRFVASFVGSSNILPPDFTEAVTGQRRWASLRPEAITVTTLGEALRGRIVTRSFLGATTRLGIELPDGTKIHASVPAGQSLPADGQVGLNFPREALHLMEAAT
ncbi:MULTISPECIES: ABC transporter ATP-binding protein [unclassified Aureimonas]|uniref:ABC transporter ATP-binding protein n=1 Tax=unclassified Aureimonas TaxID=2615206 RepID=UPI0006F2B92F|nr:MULTISPECIES: ABC transporter ATP-binding protein [unclassified Aureimonas]KQT52888.1 polyamine ABC transporter ATP-binding protein [Aureimonas sp. Leaf427]KQT80347.1 polyamine ABC transporter ATP-binding protein [Aureimonas sp. Leaf460]